MSQRANRVELSVESRGGRASLAFGVRHLVCCGWVSRDKLELQAHIDELASLGVPPPTRIPILMHLPPYLVSTDDEVEVVSATTSGEIEYVLLCDGADTWVTVGSDHTDRRIEAVSMVASKQMGAKHIARDCWPLSEIQSHWDLLILKCTVSKDGESTLYQESTLASILSPADLLPRAAGGLLGTRDGLVLFSGTVPTQSGLLYGDGYDLVLHDPVLNRTISTHYHVRILQQEIE